MMKIRQYIEERMLGNLILKLRVYDELVGSNRKKDPAHFEWVQFNLINIVEEFAREYKLLDTYFMKTMKKALGDNCFELLLKKVTAEYLSKLFDIFAACRQNLPQVVTLENNPLNRMAEEKYFSDFDNRPEIKWIKVRGLIWNIFISAPLNLAAIFPISLNKGVRIFGKKKKYKIMREALWGLYGVGGEYFHDDFVVDEKTVKKEELLLFTRGIQEKGRLKAYSDARESPYACFDVRSLRIGLKPLFKRIISKYFFLGTCALLGSAKSEYFSLFSSLYLFFIVRAVPYEKIFSNFEIKSELGHLYSAPGHIVEASICRHYGAKYYLMHWSDNSVKIDNYLLAYLACDKFLVWGKYHVSGVEGDVVIDPVGYIFKKSVEKAKSERDEILRRIGVREKNKVVSFFDESFSHKCKMTEEDYLNFWKAAVKFAFSNKSATVLMKPKTLARYKGLSKENREDFLRIKSSFEELENTHLIDGEKWSFVEIIGASDAVVTQGMTSSATIAIISGINGFYFDQAKYGHPLKPRFKDRLVFDDADKLIRMLTGVIRGEENPIKDIPESDLRGFDAFGDDLGIDRLRHILAGEAVPQAGSISRPEREMKLI